MTTQSIALPPLPEWTKHDDLDGKVPSEIRQAMREYAEAAVALSRQQAPVGDKVVCDSLGALLLTRAERKKHGVGAPVGDSVDTPEFRELVSRCFYAFTGDNLAIARAALIAHITAWKDAQLERERQGRASDSFSAASQDDLVVLGGLPKCKVCKDTGIVYTGPVGDPPEQCDACFDQEPVPQAQGEPVAEFELRSYGDRPFEVYWHGEVSKLPGGLYYRDYKVGDKVKLYTGPAPQADEVRDAALEEAAKLMESTDDHIWANTCGQKIRALKGTK